MKKPTVCLIIVLSSLIESVVYISCLGMRFFRIRLLELLESMFKLEPIHFAAAFLHPRYRFLRRCSNSEIKACHNYIRREMQEVEQLAQFKRVISGQSSTSDVQNFEEPPAKRKRRFGEEFESGNVSDEYGDTEDEVDVYVSMQIDNEKLIDNPLPFWKANQKQLPKLAKIARKIHSIPATTASVEREFSASGLVVTERRSALSPNNVNNIIFLRSVT